MHIQPAAQPALPRRLPDGPVQPEPEKPKKEEPFWHELGNDLRSFFLYSDGHRVQETTQLIKNIAFGIRNGWRILRLLPEKVLDLPAVKANVDDDTRDHWALWSERIGLFAGFSAAGGQALLGATKLASGFRSGNTGRKLDGLVDLASATALAVTVAGLAGARLLFAPVAAGINIVRGGFNAATGFKQHDERKQLQGALDLTRSFGAMGRILQSQSAAMNVMGVAFAPIAGTLQAGRGLRDIKIGLKNDDKKMIVRGLADVATAVGTGLAFASGAAVIPGVALAVVANGTKVAYQLSPRFRRAVNRKLEQWEPRLEKVVTRAEQWSRPVVAGWRSLMSRLFQQVDPAAPEKFTPAELAEVMLLLFADGAYARDERARLKTTLEETGQAKELPPLDAPPPQSQRQTLLQQLKSPQQRQDFLAFMVVVAEYDFRVKPEEKAYLQALTLDLGLPLETLEQLLAQNRDRPLPRAGAAASGGLPRQTEAGPGPAKSLTRSRKQT